MRVINLYSSLGLWTAACLNHPASAFALVVPNKIISLNNNIQSSRVSSGTRTTTTTPTTQLHLSDDSPSDYDPIDVLEDEKVLTVDENEEDAAIRDELKRELLLLATVTSRGECATNEERDIIIDLVTQLEALNPTSDPASCCQGEWDLVLSSTQFFRSSPFFMAIRSALGEGNKDIADTGFDIHERATSAGRVGRVRQIVTDDQLTSEVDLNVGMMPGFPVVIKGTVITTADLSTVSPETWELRVKSTKVNRSNVPFLDQYLDDFPYELPVGQAYQTLTGSTPVSVFKTFYVDQGIRISRDVDDNFFVFARA